jgi:hypothetical protein
MPAFSDLVAIPPKDAINSGLTPVSERWMLERFGKPGPLTLECSDVGAKAKIRPSIQFGVDVGPFKVSGLDAAVTSLTDLFSEVKRDLPDVYNQVKNGGLLCVRARRHNPSVYSNHSWGTAIDLFFGEGVTPMGKRATQRGVLLLYHFFHKHGWYWGAEFPGDSVDSMHFEMSEEVLDI